MGGDPADGKPREAERSARAIGWLRIVRSGFGDEAQGFGAVVSVVEEGLVE
jgi:hypothetical protein